MRKSILYVLLLTLQLSSAFAQTDVRARAYVQPEEGMLAGQQFTLYIQVQTETNFAISPVFPEVVLDSTTAIRPEQLGTSFSERIGGKTFVGIRQRYLLSAQKAGVLDIPSYIFNFGVSDTESGEEVPVNVMTEEISLNIVMPEGLDSIHNVAVTPSLTLSERYDPPLRDLKVGDAFLRSVSLESNNSMSFLLPEISFQAQQGFSVYPSTPSFEDNTVRGRSTGKRTDSASYILQEEGEFELPEINVQWFDTSTNSLKTLSLDQQILQVSPNPETLEVIVNKESDSMSDEVLEKIINAVNWLISHIKLIALIVAFLVCGRFAWNKYASELFQKVSKIFYLFVKSGFCSRLKLILSCVFFTHKSIKKQLGIWVKIENNQGFKSSQSWQDMNSNYSEGGSGKFSRAKLIIELLFFSFRKKKAQGHFQSKLNP